MSPVLTKKYNQVEKDKDIANFTCNDSNLHVIQ